MKSYKDSKCRKNILKTLRTWGGDGVEGADNLMSHIDHEIEKYTKFLKSDET